MNRFHLKGMEERLGAGIVKAIAIFAHAAAQAVFANERLIVA